MGLVNAEGPGNWPVPRNSSDPQQISANSTLKQLKVGGEMVQQREKVRGITLI